MSRVIEYVKEKYPDAKDVHQADAYCVDGQFLVPATFLEDFFGVTRRTITGWQSQGMPCEFEGDRSKNLYDLGEVIGWYVVNVDLKAGRGNSKKKKAPAAAIKNASVKEEVPLYDVDPGTASIETLERLNKYEDLKKKQLSNAEAEGRLIPAEDQDRAMAEQAVLHRGQYLDDLEVLPGALEGKNRSQIKKFLETHYERRVNNVHKFITKLYDIPDWLNLKINELIGAEIDGE